VPEIKTPKSGNTLAWNVAKSQSFKSGTGKFTTAMKVYVPWWKRKTLWILGVTILIIILIQIDVDTGGSLYDIAVGIFNWVRTQPWLTLSIGGGIGYFVRDRAIQLVSRHEIMPGLEKK